MPRRYKLQTYILARGIVRSNIPNHAVPSFLPRRSRLPARAERRLHDRRRTIDRPNLRLIASRPRPDDGPIQIERDRIVPLDERGEAKFFMQIEILHTISVKCCEILQMNLDGLTHRED